MKLDDIYQSKYLKAGDVRETPMPFTITGVEVEEIGRNKEEKLVITFKGEKKGFVCNRTNAKTIGKALGQKKLTNGLVKPSGFTQLKYSSGMKWLRPSE